MRAYNKKTGAEVLGTAEILSGRANVIFRRDPDGSIQYEHDGSGTEVFWDCAETQTNADGEVIFLDENGDEVTRADIELEDEEDDDE